MRFVLEFLAFPSVLVLIALVFQSLGLLVRDGLFLRILFLVGTVFYLLFYHFDDVKPIAIFSSSVLGLVNFCMIVVLIFERTTFTMDEETERIYESFPTLNPGQFRRVLRAAQVREANPGKILVRDGKRLSKLFLVTRGQVKISKGEKEYLSDANVFIGEVSFLRKGTASATVTVSKDAKYLEWEHGILRKMMNRSAPLSNALIALLGAELAGKAEKAMPVDLGESDRA